MHGHHLSAWDLRPLVTVCFDVFQPIPPAGSVQEVSQATLVVYFSHGIWKPTKLQLRFRCWAAFSTSQPILGKADSPPAAASIRCLKISFNPYLLRGGAASPARSGFLHTLQRSGKTPLLQPECWIVCQSGESSRMQQAESSKTVLCFHETSMKGNCYVTKTKRHSNPNCYHWHLIQDLMQSLLASAAYCIELP